MLRFTLITYLMVFATAAPVFAQQPIEDGAPLTNGGSVGAKKNAPHPGVEIGTLFGFSHLRPFSATSFVDNSGFWVSCGY